MAGARSERRAGQCAWTPRALLQVGAAKGAARGEAVSGGRRAAGQRRPHSQEALHPQHGDYGVYERERIGEVELEDGEHCGRRGGRRGGHWGDARPSDRNAGAGAPARALRGAWTREVRRRLGREAAGPPRACTCFIREHDAGGRRDVEEAVGYGGHRRPQYRQHWGVSQALPGRLRARTRSQGPWGRAQECSLHPRIAARLPHSSQTQHDTPKTECKVLSVLLDGPTDPF